MSSDILNYMERRAQGRPKLARSAVRTITYASALTLISALLLVFPADEVIAQEAPAAPSISSITRSLGRDGAIYVVGRAAPGSSVDIEVVSEEQGPVFRDVARTTPAGEWTITVPDASFPGGAYVLRAIVRDQQGRASPPIEARGFKVKPEPLLSISGVEFGSADVLIMSILLIIAFAGLGGWYYEHERRKREVYAAAAKGTIANTSVALQSDLMRLQSLLQHSPNLAPQAAAEAQAIIHSEGEALAKLNNFASTEQK